mgnify:CR=1 FL=1
MYTMAQFQAMQRQKKRPILYFWGENPTAQNPITKDCLSQWYPASFEEDGIYYATSEHYMMAQKAMLFQDDEKVYEILNAIHPSEAKKLGRQVRHFSRNVWDQHKTDIVTRGNVLKFQQNESLRQFLYETKGKWLIEASPVDNIWGIGRGEEDPLLEQFETWSGQNLLGFSIMEARERLFEETMFS